MLKLSLNRSRMTGFLCSAVMVVLLTACGGGSAGQTQSAEAVQQQGASAAEVSGSAPVPASPSAPAESSPPASKPASVPEQKSNLVIEYYGASSVWGAQSGNTGNQVAITEPKAFQAALPAYTPYTTIINRGISGATARDWLNGSANLGISIPWTTQMAQSKASIVIMQIGINDMNTYSLDEYIRNLTALVQQARAAGKAIILETPGPADNGALVPFAQGMIDVATRLNVPLIDQYTYWNAYMAADHVAIRTLVPDGTHPSDAWYIQKGQYAASVFVKLFP
jgi:lysophospholipase L1-like esterase